MKKRRYINKFNGFFYTFLSKDYRSLMLLVCFVTFVMSVIVSILVYNSYKRSVDDSLNNSIRRANNALMDTFKQTEHFMKYVATNIVDDPKNLELISLSLNDVPSERYIEAKKVLSWTFFEWVDHNDFQIVNQKDGILPNPIDMSSRDYVKKSK